MAETTSASEFEALSTLNLNISVVRTSRPSTVIPRPVKGIREYVVVVSSFPVTSSQNCSLDRKEPQLLPVVGVPRSEKMVTDYL